MPICLKLCEKMSPSEPACSLVSATTAPNGDSSGYEDGLRWRDTPYARRLRATFSSSSCDMAATVVADVDDQRPSRSHFLRRRSTDGTRRTWLDRMSARKYPTVLDRACTTRSSTPTHCSARRHPRRQAPARALQRASAPASVSSIFRRRPVHEQRLRRCIARHRLPVDRHDAFAHAASTPMALSGNPRRRPTWSPCTMRADLVRRAAVDRLLQFGRKVAERQRGRLAVIAAAFVRMRRAEFALQFPDEIGQLGARRHARRAGQRSADTARPSPRRTCPASRTGRAAVATLRAASAPTGRRHHRRADARGRSSRSCATAHRLRGVTDRACGCRRVHAQALVVADHERRRIGGHGAAHRRDRAAVSAFTVAKSNISSRPGRSCGLLRRARAGMAASSTATLPPATPAICAKRPSTTGTGRRVAHDARRGRRARSLADARWTRLVGSVGSCLRFRVERRWRHRCNAIRYGQRYAGSSTRTARLS